MHSARGTPGIAPPTPLSSIPELVAVSLCDTVQSSPRHTALVAARVSMLAMRRSARHVQRGCSGLSAVRPAFHVQLWEVATRIAVHCVVLRTSFRLKQYIKEEARILKIVDYQLHGIDILWYGLMVPGCHVQFVKEPGLLARSHMISPRRRWSYWNQYSCEFERV